MLPGQGSPWRCRRELTRRVTAWASTQSHHLCTRSTTDTFLSPAYARPSLTLSTCCSPLTPDLLVSARTRTLPTQPAETVTNISTCPCPIRSPSKAKATLQHRPSQSPTGQWPPSLNPPAPRRLLQELTLISTWCRSRESVAATHPVLLLMGKIICGQSDEQFFSLIKWSLCIALLRGPGVSSQIRSVERHGLPVGG